MKNCGFCIFQLMISKSSLLYVPFILLINLIIRTGNSKNVIIGIIIQLSILAVAKRVQV